MNHAHHSTALVYELDDKDGMPCKLEVGTVSCVPRKGELIGLRVPGEQRHTFRVEQVEWDVNDETCVPTDATHGARFTVVRVALSRLP